MEKKLKINFILPFIVKTGGIIVVLEYYRKLNALGHDVEIYYPLVPYWNLMPPKLKSSRKIKIFITLLVRNVFRKKKNLITWHFEHVPVKPVPIINKFFIKNADVTVATTWITAFNVAKLPLRKGRKFYFIQDYENWFDNTNLINKSYELPLKLITISPWLSELMKNKFNREITGEIVNGIRLDKFIPPEKKEIKNSILMLYHEQELKGSKDGISALNMISKEYSDIEVTLFGIYQRPEYLDSGFNYIQNPPVEKLISLYQKATIFIFPSHQEGWGLPPMEAMACGCAVVATNVGCIRSVNNGKNVLIVNSNDPVSIYNALKKLLEYSLLRDQIAKEGYKTVQDYTWEKAALKMERILYKVLKEYEK
ncbi:MAG: glycosyltransferase family 4 protein [Fibrobacter sp.]|nr:glycosyltransferase family 4 protein [Fibrobacter sp.]